MKEVLTTFLILCMATLGSGRPAGCKRYPAISVNVVQFGALGDGITDDSQAFLKAWSAICGGGSKPPMLYIPKGRTFLLKPVTFQGPCKSSFIHVEIEGNIVAPKDIKAWTGFDMQNWIVFSNVNGLSLKGNGQIDGEGSIWWQQADKLQRRPTALAFSNCNNLQLNGLTHINSQSSHISITGSNGVSISNLRIFAPDESPNTDGIDIGRSTNVQIHNCKIGTGDDCIAIGGGSSYINISRVACGPGHGISIGSLGANGVTDTVEEVHVRDSSFKGTTNGARIKTWQGGSGYARKISFERISLEAAANPIIIDQYYCIHKNGCKNQTSGVKVSDILYSGFVGTSSTDEAIKLRCSESVGCTNIVLNNNNIKSVSPGEVTHASCFNAHGKSGPSVPAMGCLQ